MTTVPTAVIPPGLRRRVRFAWMALFVCGFVALAWVSFVPPLPRVIYNPTDSEPVGWYGVDPFNWLANPRRRAPHLGSIVLAHLPARAALLAAQRDYLPLTVPLLKRVGAVAPQRVCIVGRSVRIDGVPVATVLATDHLGRPLPSWRQCRQLRPGELFLLSATNPASFDSRYFGPVAASAVIGVAHPLWLEARP